MPEEKDYYSILQINRRASAEEIERSYQRLAKAYNPETSRKRHARERWEQIKQAYEVLSDPDERARYDREQNPRTIAGRVVPGDSAVTRFLSSRYGLMSVAGVVAIIVVAAVVISLLSGGDDGGLVAADPDTSPTAATQTGTPAPTPTGIAPANPPPVDGEEVTTESGLTYIVVEGGEGDGASPVLGDTVRVHYTGWLQSDGSKFDSSVDREEPSNFVLGQVIEGWNEGLQLMQEGDTYRFIIPPELAYGESGTGSGIPPNATLIFDVELIAVNPGPDETEAAEETAEASPAEGASE